jgi:hypothetical protein
MEYIAPLIQTVLWVGLIAGIVWRFHTPIYGLLVALQKRIESGSSVKAGPFEITDQLKPQDASAQKEKAAVEIQEVLEGQAPGTGIAKPTTAPLSTIQARYFQAEDLALRAIQSEYGSPISRQVTAGRDSGFDGVFTSGGRTSVVEVKYVLGKGQATKIRPAIHRLTKIIQQYNWENTQIVLVLVFENEEDVKHSMELLSQAFSENAIPVEVRVFTMAHLLARFGV